MIQVRRLTLAEAPAFRALRLDALRDHPADFGSTHATEAMLPLAHFVGQLADNHVLGVFLDGVLTGVAAIGFRAKAKEAHRADLWGVYVAPGGQGRGAAQARVDAALAVGFARAEQIELSVRVGNARALALYRSRGFVATGTELRSYRVDGRDYDNTLMVKFRPATT